MSNFKSRKPNTAMTEVHEEQVQRSWIDRTLFPACAVSDWPSLMYMYRIASHIMRTRNNA